MHRIDLSPPLDTTTGPQIFVAPASDHPDSLQLGRWIPAAPKPETIEADLRSVRATSTPSGQIAQWKVFDFAGFGSWPLDSNTDTKTIAGVAALILEFGPAAAALYGVHARTHQAARAIMERQYLGAYFNLADFAERAGREMSPGAFRRLPRHITSAIDWDAAGAGLESSGMIFGIRSGLELHIFSRSPAWAGDQETAPAQRRCRSNDGDTGGL